MFEKYACYSITRAFGAVYRLELLYPHHSSLHLCRVYKLLELCICITYGGLMSCNPMVFFSACLLIRSCHTTNSWVVGHKRRSSYMCETRWEAVLFCALGPILVLHGTSFDCACDAKGAGQNDLARNILQLLSLFNWFDFRSQSAFAANCVTAYQHHFRQPAWSNTALAGRILTVWHADTLKFVEANIFELCRLWVLAADE